MPEFLKEYLVLIICGIAIIASLIFISVILIKKRHQTNNSSKKLLEELVLSFGGRKNIISASAKGSRLSLILEDYSLIDEEKLRKYGVTSSIKMSNKITFIIGEKADDLEKYINQIKN